MAQPAGTTIAITRGLSAHVLDFVIPAAILLAVLVVLAPVPAPIVDLMLAANLTVSVLALLGALAARTPLEMSIFPTFLLGATLVRLVLNVATTRLILTRAAAEGTNAAGGVVQAFSEFVAANNLIVGAVIFAIIAVIQFVVITAGSTRTSEVAARFALDGLPGRQMAIDTEVQAGTITREHARQLRLDLQRQADFFASMDGASRFVRGEAVAGVVITVVNIVGGLAIGVAQHGMPIQKAIGVYSRLTIGDGLSSAVPSLFVSVATGLLISRSSQSVDLSQEFGRQFTSRPHVLLITAVFLGLLCLTDLPPLPLAVMAILTMAIAWMSFRRTRDIATHSRPSLDRSSMADQAPTAPLAETVLADDRIVVHLGRDLLRLVSPQQGGDEGPLVSKVAGLRSAIAGDLGLVMPSIQFRDDVSLPAGAYRVTIAGDIVQEDEIHPGRWFIIATADTLERLDGNETVDPLTRRRGTWVGEAQADTARRHAAEVLDESAMVARGIEAAVRMQADRILTRDAVSRLVESLRTSQPALVDSIVPDVLTVARIHRTLQVLLRDGVPIRPLAELLEIMSDHAPDTRDPDALAEVVRRHLARTICRRARDRNGRLTIIRLDAATIARLMKAESPGVSPQFVAGLRRALRPGIERGAAPVLVVPGAMRIRIRDMLARLIPELRILAEEEIANEPRVEIFTTLGDGEVSRAA